SMMNCPTSVVEVGSVCVAHARNSSIWSGDSRPVPPFRSNRTSASTPPSWNSLCQMPMVESSMNSASATAAKDQPRSSSRTAFARRQTRFSSSPSLAIATRSTRSAALRKLRFVFTRRLESIPVIRSNDFRKGEESRYIHFSAAQIIVLVQDNLSIHSKASLYQAFPAAEARRLVERFEWHYTPKHGSWLNLAESELGVLSSQCLDRRIPDKQILVEEVAAWQQDRNANHAKANWHFTTPDARIKLKHLYPSI